MATPHSGQAPVGPDTLITVKVQIGGQNRRFKLALRDLGAHTLPQKLTFLLQIPKETNVLYERFSDSAGMYISLDPNNPAIYKQLYRAAKAKLKLRLKATVLKSQGEHEVAVAQKDDASTPAKPRNTYLETVLSHVPLANIVEPTTSSDKLPPPTAGADSSAGLSRPTLPTLNDFCTGTFSIDCNNCGNSVLNEHYHCGKCEMGDFDLCSDCIERGITCNGEDHWLIKRMIKNGKVYASNTETMSPKKKVVAPEIPKMAHPPVHLDVSNVEEQRTCNSCIIQLPARSFVTCQQCPDYDLCFFCLEHGQHGHHPAHKLSPADSSCAEAGPYIKLLCMQGRGVRHEAVCDSCDAQIIGVRHKCQTCPDFDFCDSCIKLCSQTHPGHRFAAVYDQLPMLANKKELHRGIRCDGFLCTNSIKQGYIRGDRYKCAICDDTDFCANCEAHPNNTHNRSHPLIKFCTAVKGVSITSFADQGPATVPAVLGDRRRRSLAHASTSTVNSSTNNAATQVQTVAETKPAEVKQEKTGCKLYKSPSLASAPEHQAWFESESTPDGSSFPPSHMISQSWTLRNPGPTTWPAGCAVHYIGGDDMRNLDSARAGSVDDVAKASKSNALTEPLESGKTGVFTVMLRSPPREGRCISYWRLKTDDGVPFGHKLWCDVLVAKSIESAMLEAPKAVKEAAVEDKDSMSSQMIFPVLDKESPSSSIHSNLSTAPSEIRSVQAPSQYSAKQPVQEDIVTVPSVTSEADVDQDLLDDLESMGVDDEDETEDGFMTDEEYDILDAEDEDLAL